MSALEFHKKSSDIRKAVPTLETRILQGSTIIQITHVQSRQMMSVFVLRHLTGERSQFISQAQFHESIQDKIIDEELEIDTERKLVLVRTNKITGGAFLYYRALVLKREEDSSKVELIDCGAPTWVENMNIFTLPDSLRNVTCPVVRIELIGQARYVSEMLTIPAPFTQIYGENPFVIRAKLKRGEIPWTNEDVVKEICFKVSNRYWENQHHISRPFKINFDASSTAACLKISQPLDRRFLKKMF
ncbi:Oidioi.mRNA.OKI2018_I69.chr2.g6555.t1.cds [Oikopleura dioica]|uniref:Oidioi.mRNA.OKI2018_I69.chr2.g6555.t1.cds n=1 Tax=Oikopleura dioica TaxID=34765 RepID=A0ABN7T872_OIKDI|nr:Oidioi.mRNA.OKI2018_I69.chr2.g6555.t1.cds [Oikopleura dioica]